ncbi:hypothetical protein NDU88_002200 [Pleurodeles waltl]|uniref:Uncharacterized protein n=1 Tax=Pleurodeles waltl TaxID=8319 RepID=A0AAV7MLY0_PLEWA|nr:hypothetical protein NDU88_002200 [Pleurodeles waltl]
MVVVSKCTHSTVATSGIRIPQRFSNFVRRRRSTAYLIAVTGVRGAPDDTGEQLSLPAASSSIAPKERQGKRHFHPEALLARTR